MPGYWAEFRDTVMVIPSNRTDGVLVLSDVRMPKGFAELVCLLRLWSQ